MNDFKRTFDAIKMSGRSEEQIRLELSSCLNKYNKKDCLTSENSLILRKSPILILVVVIILAISLVGFAFANHIIKLLGGGKIEQGKTIFGEDFVSISTGIVHAPVKVEGEEIYFILDGQNINITDQCSDSSFYKYEKTNDNGYRHVVVIGGTFDNVGVGEFIWDEMDNFIGSNASFNSHEEPEWLKSAEIELRKQ